MYPLRLRDVLRLRRLLLVISTAQVGRRLAMVVRVELVQLHDVTNSSLLRVERRLGRRVLLHQVFTPFVTRLHQLRLVQTIALLLHHEFHLIRGQDAICCVLLWFLFTLRTACCPALALQRR